MQASESASRRVQYWRKGWWVWEAGNPLYCPGMSSLPGTQTPRSKDRTGRRRAIRRSGHAALYTLYPTNVSALWTQSSPQICALTSPDNDSYIIGQLAYRCDIIWVNVIILNISYSYRPIFYWSGLLVEDTTWLWVCVYRHEEEKQWQTAPHKTDTSTLTTSVNKTQIKISLGL